MDLIYVKTLKTSFLDHFLDTLGSPDTTGLFFENRLRSFS